MAAALSRRPDLWRTALSRSAALAPRGWWRRPPFLPVPPPEYLAWRAECATGDPHGPLDPQEVVSWLEWCRGPGHLVRYSHRR